jgi:small GTP-binding protein
MSDSFNQLMKLIIIGDSGTGKSCLLHRFVEDAFSEEQTQTIGVEFGAKVVQLQGQRVKLQIWDTAGQERYRSVTRGYYRGAVGCLIVYDVTCRSSYDHVSKWLADVRELAGDEVVAMLVGNKADLATDERRAVSNNEAALFAQEQGLFHFETSAATGEFVGDAFMKVARCALDRASSQDDVQSAVDLAPQSRKCSC